MSPGVFSSCSPLTPPPGKGSFCNFLLQKEVERLNQFKKNKLPLYASLKRGPWCHGKWVSPTGFL